MVLFVFDLDDTLWYPEMYMIDGEPFRKESGRVFDCRGTEINLFPDVPRILLNLRERFPEAKVAFASRTYYPERALRCIELLDIVPDALGLKEVVDLWEIYPADKTKHFNSLRQRTGIPFEEMVFFDNERRNLVDVKQLGVHTVYTPNGMTWKAWTKALDIVESMHL